MKSGVFNCNQQRPIRIDGTYSDHILIRTVAVNSETVHLLFWCQTHSPDENIPYLLNHLIKLSIHPNKQSAIQASLLLDCRSIARIACKMATINEPKATDPNEVVIVLLNAFLDGLSNCPELKYQVAATPLYTKQKEYKI